MAITITDSDGNDIQQVYTCSECTYCSTKRHFRSTEDGLTCVLCDAPAEKINRNP